MQRSVAVFLFMILIAANFIFADDPIILNEYDAINDNGENWLEFIVTKDNLDLSDSYIDIEQNGYTLGHYLLPPVAELKNLRKGTIITFSDTRATDYSYHPVTHNLFPVLPDWHININVPGLLITNHEARIRIRARHLTGDYYETITGWAGEGQFRKENYSYSGNEDKWIDDTEIFKLKTDPDHLIKATNQNYGDDNGLITTSSFGSANYWLESNGTPRFQDLSDIRRRNFYDLEEIDLISLMKTESAFKLKDLEAIEYIEALHQYVIADDNSGQIVTLDKDTNYPVSILERDDFEAFAATSPDYNNEAIRDIEGVVSYKNDDLQQRLYVFVGDNQEIPSVFIVKFDEKNQMIIESFLRLENQISSAFINAGQLYVVIKTDNGNFITTCDFIKDPEDATQLLGVTYGQPLFISAKEIVDFHYHILTGELWYITLKEAVHRLSWSDFELYQGLDADISTYATNYYVDEIELADADLTEHNIRDPRGIAIIDDYLYIANGHDKDDKTGRPTENPVFKCAIHIFNLPQ